MSKILVAVAAMLVAVFVAQAQDAKDAKKADAPAAAKVAAAKVPDTAAGKLQIKKEGEKIAAITIITIDGKPVALEIDEATVKQVKELDGKNVEAKLADADNDGLAEIKEIKAAK